MRVPAGSTVAVAGPSGAGKTTLLRTIAGLARPRRGHIAFGDDVWLDTGAGVDVPAERRPVGLVFQDYALFPHLDVGANVAFPLAAAGVPRRDRARRADELLERLGVGGLAAARPAALSGGERQRVALARALARDPRVLLLDEPLASLDATTRIQVAAELRALLADIGLTAILVTHSFDEAATLADTIVVLEGGVVVQTGSPAEILAAPAVAAGTSETSRSRSGSWPRSPWPPPATSAWSPEPRSASCSPLGRRGRRRSPRRPRRAAPERTW